MLAAAYATGRASHTRQVKGDYPDKKGYPGPPSWGFGVGLTTPHSKKLIVMKVEKRKSWMDLTMMERVGDRWEKNGRILFDRPKPTVGSSASGRRRIYSDFTLTLRSVTCDSKRKIMCQCTLKASLKKYIFALAYKGLQSNSVPSISGGP
jgi:hypothetical protein